MKTLQILMPMAGRGSRFAEQGYTVPKCCIEVHGMPMFLRAISSLASVAAAKTLTVVTLAEHERNWGITALIKAHMSSAQVVLLPEVTKGPVETCLAARSLLDDSQALLSLDCDLWFQSVGFDAAIASVLSGDSGLAGVLTSFESTLPRYSYARSDASSLVVETAEKQVISNRALIGAYFFSSAGLFFDAATNLLLNWESQQQREPTVSLLYNYLIARNHSVLLTSADKYESYGTPEELRHACSDAAQILTTATSSEPAKNSARTA